MVWIVLGRKLAVFGASANEGLISDLAEFRCIFGYQTVSEYIEKIKTKPGEVGLKPFPGQFLWGW